MSYILYLAVNQVNQRKHVGYTRRTLNTRKYFHLYESRHGSNLYFHNALRKYGPEQFHWFVIGWADSKQEIDELEKSHIQFYRGLGDALYNLTSGGSVDYSLDGEVREKLSPYYFKAGNGLGIEGGKATRIKEGQRISPITEFQPGNQIGKATRFRKGVRRSPETEFKPGSTQGHRIKKGERVSPKTEFKPGSTAGKEFRIKKGQSLSPATQFKPGPMTQEQKHRLHIIKKIKPLACPTCNSVAA